jgi:YVTN family beta-propeller protein
MKYLLYLTLLSFLYITGCDSSDPSVTQPTVSKGILVLNEGLFGQNNSTLTYYNLDTKTVSQQVYRNANGGANLGDTGSDIAITDYFILVAVDNSNKIEKLDPDTFSSLGHIDLGQGGSPRAISIFSLTRAFVTSTYGDVVYEINPTELTVTDTIPVGSKPEGMLLYKNKLFVANSGFGNDSTLSIIDLNTNKESKRLTVGLNPRYVYNVLYDVVVVCTGSYDTGMGSIYKIDAVVESIIDSMQMPGNPKKGAAFGNDALLVINADGIQRVNMNNMTTAGSPFIAGTDVNSALGVIYSIYYDNLTQNIYCSNPKDYQQNGEVVVFDNLGNELYRFATGINPGSIGTKTE